MNGIDISSWQAGLDTAKVSADFVIIKATEGTNYVNPNCDRQYQAAAGAGKKLGVYHFARNSKNSAQAEADFFVNNVKGYIKHAILILDWEDGVSDVAWAAEWIKRVTDATGVVPMIYMSESVVNSYDWSSVVAMNVGLWVAKYRDMVADFNYNMDLAGTPPSVKWWKGYAMWQWTSSGRLDGYDANLDCSRFYGDKAAWDKYAGGAPAPAATTGQVANPQTTPQPAAQTYVVKSGENLSSIAAKFGTTYQHLAAVNGIANPNVIYAGQVLRIDGGAPASRTVMVNRGDTLSAIAARNGTTWQALQAANGLPNPNLIYPGQVLRLP